METPAPVAAPAATEQTPPIVTTASGPIRTFVAANTNAPIGEQPDAGRGSLPTNLEDIEGFFAGTKTLEVSPAALEPDPNAHVTPVTPPVVPVVAAPVVPVVPPPAVPSVAPVVAPVTPVAAPASEPPIGADLRRALQLQASLNGDRKPGDAGYVPIRDAIQKIEEADRPADVIPPGPSAVELATTALTTVTTNLATIESDLEALRAERRALGEDSSFYGPKAIELGEKIEAKTLELSDARHAKQTADTAVRQASDAEQAAVTALEMKARREATEQAAKNFPTAADHASPLGKRITGLVQAMQDPKHPDHAVLFTPNAAIYVSERAAIQEATEIAAGSNGTVTFAQAFDSLRGPAPGAATTAAVEAEPRRVSPAAGATGIQPQAAALTEAQIMKASIDDPDSIDQYLYQGQRAHVLTI